MANRKQNLSLKSLGIALVITTTFFIIELAGAFLTNSLALLTDAWHMLIDVFALVFAFVASWLALKPVDVKKTYGYYRIEIIAAFLNGIFLLVIVIYIFYEAIERFLHPVEVKSLGMLIIATFGLITNGLSGIMLSKYKEESLNVKGAFLHVITDTLSSVGAISAGLIMLFTGWYQADSLISIIIGLLILYSSSRLIKESLNILLEGVPSDINMNVLEKKLLELREVERVHDLHVWCIAPKKMRCMSGHIVVKERIDRKRLMARLINMLKEEFGIDHSTIQLEDEDYPKAMSEH